MRLHKTALGFAVATSAFAGSGAFAQDETVEEIVVTSSRIPRPLSQIGTSVSVIDAEDIEAHGNLSLVDVLRQMPSISTSNSGGAGKATSLRIRGEEGFRTLTLFDGIRLTDPSSTQVGPQLEHLLSSGVGRVEVLRGPQGLSYGADAGGVVNIISRRPGEDFSANFDVQAGEFDTHQYSGNAGGSAGAFDYFVSLADFETEGFNTRGSDSVLQDDDGYENTTLHGRVGFALSERLRFDVVHRKVDGDTEFDGCFSGTTVHDCTSTYELGATRLGAEYTGEDFSHSLSYAVTDTDRENFALGAPSFSSNGELKRWEYVGSATGLPGFDLVAGADWEEALNNGVGRNNTGVYGEILSDFSDSLFLTAGVRHDDNDDFGTNTSYRLSGAYLVDLANDSLLKFRGSYGTGFRAPSPFEIAYNSGPFAFPPASNVNLRQETSRGWEAGVEFDSGSLLHLEAIYFDQEVEDAIFFDVDAFSGYLQDIGTSSSRGVELFGEAALTESLSLTANYTWNDTERPGGLPRRRRPEHLANLGASWFGMGERLNINAFYRISRDSIDEAGGQAVALDDFEVLDLSANFSVTDSFQLYGRIENALDEDYQEIIDYTTPGRAAYVGFRFQFGAL